MINLYFIQFLFSFDKYDCDPINILMQFTFMISVYSFMISSKLNYVFRNSNLDIT